MEAPECTLQDKLKDTPIYEYYLLHPENASLNTIMTKTRKFLLSTHELSIIICYAEILKSDPGIIYDIFPYLDPNKDIGNLTVLAITQYNKEIIEFLYKNETKRITKKHTIIQCVRDGYEKNGAEIIYFMGNLGIPIYKSTQLFYCVIEKNDMDLIKYIIDLAGDNQKNLNRLFLTALMSKEVVKLFIGRVDVSKLKNEIFEELLDSRHLDDEIAAENIKILVDYFGMTIDDNTLLSRACKQGNLALAEFCLQYGVQVDSNLLRKVLRDPYMDILELFVRYGVDFSLFKVKNVSKTFSDMGNLGLDKDALLHLLIYKRN